MTTKDFCYWLQGFFEIEGSPTPQPMSARQTQIIQNHLAPVFRHDIDPKAGGPEVQKELNAIHSGFNKDTVLRC